MDVHEVSDKKCSQCGKTFPTNYRLKNHVKCVHEKRKDFKCDYCDNAFFNVSKMKAHIKRVHEKIKDNICVICKKSYSDKGDLSKLSPLT